LPQQFCFDGFEECFHHSIVIAIPSSAHGRVEAIQAVLSGCDSFMPSQETYTKQEQLELTLVTPDTDAASRTTPKAFVALIAPTVKVVVEELSIDPYIIKTQAALKTDW
jgi:flagellum-specific peptidoglycan hydrolase FlgJ